MAVNVRSRLKQLLSMKCVCALLYSCSWINMLVCKQFKMRDCVHMHISSFLRHFCQLLSSLTCLYVFERPVSKNWVLLGVVMSCKSCPMFAGILQHLFQVIETSYTDSYYKGNPFSVIFRVKQQ